MPALSACACSACMQLFLPFFSLSLPLSFFLSLSPSLFLSVCPSLSLSPMKRVCGPLEAENTDLWLVFSGCAHPVNWSERERERERVASRKCGRAESLSVPHSVSMRDYYYYLFRSTFFHFSSAKSEKDQAQVKI
jgi:hypothetical protein